MDKASCFALSRKVLPSFPSLFPLFNKAQKTRPKAVPG